MFIKVNKHFFCMIALFITFSIGVDKPMFKNSCFTFSFMFKNCFGGFWAWVCDSSSNCAAIEGKFLTLSLFLHLHHFYFKMILSSWLPLIFQNMKPSPIVPFIVFTIHTYFIKPSSIYPDIQKMCRLLLGSE